VRYSLIESNFLKWKAKQRSENFFLQFKPLRVWTQGLVLARQVLLTLELCGQPFLPYILWIGSYIYARAILDLNPPILCFFPPCWVTSVCHDSWLLDGVGFPESFDRVDFKLRFSCSPPPKKLGLQRWATMPGQKNVFNVLIFKKKWTSTNDLKRAGIKILSNQSTVRFSTSWYTICTALYMDFSDLYVGLLCWFMVFFWIHKIRQIFQLIKVSFTLNPRDHEPTGSYLPKGHQIMNLQ
jgi:hypothetical protein